MPIPWAEGDGPIAFTQSWAHALLLGNDRAPNHHKKQRIRWDEYWRGWRVEDVSEE